MVFSFYNSTSHSFSSMSGALPMLRVSHTGYDDKPNGATDATKLQT